MRKIIILLFVIFLTTGCNKPQENIMFCEYGVVNELEDGWYESLGIGFDKSKEPLESFFSYYSVDNLLYKELDGYDIKIYENNNIIDTIKFSVPSYLHGKESDEIIEIATILESMSVNERLVEKHFDNKEFIHIDKYSLIKSYNYVLESVLENKELCSTPSFPTAPVNNIGINGDGIKYQFSYVLFGSKVAKAKIVISDIENNIILEEESNKIEKKIENADNASQVVISEGEIKKDHLGYINELINQAFKRTEE